MLIRPLKTLIIGVLFIGIVSAGSIVRAQTFTRALALDSKAKSLSHYMMGVIHDLRGLVPLSIVEYEQSLKYNQENIAAHLRLGANYARVGKFSLASGHLNKVAEHNPNDLQARYLLALIYSTQRQFDKAAAQYESILKTFAVGDPNNLEIHIYLGQLYYSMGDMKKAIAQFEKIIQLDQSNSDMMYLLGSIYLEQDKQGQAIDTFQKCIAIDSENTGCLNSLGYTYAEQNIKLDAAFDLVSKAVELEPENGAYLDSLAWVHYKKENYIEALKLLKKTETLLKDPIIYDHMGDVYLKMNQPLEAKKYWRLSLELFKDQPKIKAKIDQLEKQSVRHSLQEESSID